MGKVELMLRHAKQLDKTTEVEILKADLEERGFNIKVSWRTFAMEGTM